MSASGLGIAGLARYRPDLRVRVAWFWALPRQDRYQQIVAVWLGVFCAGFCLLPAEWEQRWLFYIGIPLTLPAVVDAARRSAGGALFWTVTAFLAYSGLSALWSEKWLTVGDEIRRVFWIEYFLLIFVAIGAAGLPWLRRSLRGLLVFAALVCIYAVTDFFLHGWRDARLIGYGAHPNSNVTASVMGTIALLGLGATFGGPAVPSLAMLASQIPFCALLIATGSRAAALGYVGLVAFSGIVLVRKADRRHAARAVAIVIACIVVAVIGVALLGRNWLLSEIARGDSMRLQIWAENLRRVAERPLFGHGATTRHIVLADNGELVGLHAHNLFLAQAFYGGLLGCALWLAVFALAVRVGFTVLRERRDILPLVPLAFLLTVGNLDIGPVVLDVQPVWLYVWVVIGMALAYDIDSRRRATTSR